MLGAVYPKSTHAESRAARTSARSTAEVRSASPPGIVSFMATCAFISFRLGMADGVSVVARNWQRAIEQLGFDVCTVAGEGPVDRTVPGLSIVATDPPTEAELADAIGAPVHGLNR